MKTLILAGVAATTLMLGSLTPAAASGGCGPFGHRGWDGFCHRNFAPVPVYRPWGYGYGWHRPYGYGYGWHRPWGWGGGWHRW